MPSFRSFSLWLMRLVCLSALSGMVYVSVLSTTILDRTDIKQWLNDSGLYADNTFISSIFTLQASNSEIADISTVEQSLISSQAIKNAAARTFTAPYLQTSFESVIDSSYNWIEGQGTSFSFTVPVQEKRDFFIAELIKEVEPAIAALPLCNARAQTICRPPTPVSDFTKQIVTDSIGQSDFLQSPITQASFSAAASSSELETLSHLPALRSLISLLAWILPVIFALSLFGVWALAPHGGKLRAFIKLSRSAFSSMLLAVVLSLVVIVMERLHGIRLEEMMPPAGELTPIMAAFVTQLILGFAWALLYTAGTVLAVSIISWIVLAHYKKRTPPTQLPNVLPPSPSAIPPTSL